MMMHGITNFKPTKYLQDLLLQNSELD
jgi:hypothetical protein